ncbi:LOW QUALITY PROTEIN: hypothetical protein PanWU01x14_210080, partial [Parasponia andersonii]
DFGIDNHQASVIEEELFLLKNQIPFQVLEFKVNLTNDPAQLKNDIFTSTYYGTSGLARPHTME